MSNTALVFAGFTLNAARQSLTGPEGNVDVRPKCFEVLCHLLKRPGQVVSREELLASVWAGLTVTDESLTRCISDIRSALGDVEHTVIKTIPKRGYMLDVVVTEVASATQSMLPAQKVSRADYSDAAQQGQTIANDCRLSGPLALEARWHVGRVAALDVLDGIMAKVLAGKRRIVFVTGEAGIGKSTFVEMASDRLSLRGVSVLRGICAERYGTNEAYSPLLDALVQLCATSGGADVQGVLRAHAPAWLLQVPGALAKEQRVALENEAFGATRERLLREFCTLLEALSAERPCVVILEDLHWSDHATIDVLSRLVRRDGKASLLILATYRPFEATVANHPVKRLHKDLESREACIEIALDGLTKDEVHRLVAWRFRDEALAETVTEPIFKRTRGQPLFVTSLLNFFVDQGALKEENGTWVLASPEAFLLDVLPGNLSTMILHHIGRLTEGEQHILEVASVAGVEFPASLVSAGLSIGDLDGEQALAALARKDHLLVPNGASKWPDGTFSSRYAFRHALQQNALYARLSPGLRAHVHRRMAERLLTAYARSERDVAVTLASHFEHGHDFPAALRFLGIAAENSMTRLGHREAANYVTHALRLLDQIPGEAKQDTRIRLLRQRSWALRSAGDIQGSIRDLDLMIAAASATGNVRQEVNVLLAVSRFCLYSDRRLCLRAASEALSRSHALDDDAFKVFVQGSCASINLYLNGWRDDDAALCLEAMNLTAQAQDHTTIVRRLIIEGIIECWRSRYHECRLSATRGKQLARAVGDVYVYILFHVMEATALLHLGQWRHLSQETSEALSIAEKNANRPAIVLCRLIFAWLHVEAMDHERAKEICENIDTRAADENPFVFFFHRAVLAKALVGLRQPDQARHLFVDVQRRLETDGQGLDFTIRTQLHHCQAEFHLLTGELELARHCAEDLCAYAAPAPDRNHLSLAYALQARIAARTNQDSEAKRLIGLAVKTLGDATMPLAAWRVYRVAGEICEQLGDQAAAAEFGGKYTDVLKGLMSNFDADHCLWRSLAVNLIPQYVDRA